MSYGSRDESNLKIRGFRKDTSLILIDGRPLCSGYFGNVDLSKILSEDIDEIRIIKGPASAMYGGGSMGGVVNIITHSRDHILSLEAELSRNLRNRQRLSSAQNFGDWGYRVSLGREERSAPPLSKLFEPTLFETGGVRDHSYQKSWSTRAGLDFIIASLHEMGLSGGYKYIPYKEIPSSIYTRDYRVYRDWYMADAALIWDHYTTLNSNLRGQIYLDATGDTFERYSDSHHQYLQLSSRMEAYNLGFAPSFEYRAGDVITTGFRLEHRNIRRKDDGFYEDWTMNDAFVGNAFGQYQKELMERAILNLSIGVTGFSHSKNRDLKLIAEPSAGVSWDHPDESESMVSLGINSALPTMRQLFSADHGNPDLVAARAFKSEISHNRSISVWGQRTAIVGGSLYYNDVRDLIDLNGQRYANVYKVQSYGTELSGSMMVSPYWELSGQYAYLKQLGNYVLTESAPHSVDIQSRMRFPDYLDLSASYSWRSIRKSQDSSSTLHSLPAHDTVELGISRTFSNLELALSMQNAFDRDYQSEYGYPAPGRDFRLKIKYSFR